MGSPIYFKWVKIKLASLLLLFGFISFIGTSQVVQVNILGGAIVTQSSTITINTGSSISFRITNVETNNCKKLKVEGVKLTNTTYFSLSPNKIEEKIRPEGCKGKDKYLDFTVTANGATCTSYSTTVTIELDDLPNFSFNLTVNSSPIISVLGGSPLADVLNGSTITTATNGTFFGVVDTGFTETRTYIVTNTGSCPLSINSISSSLGDFIVGSTIYLPDYTSTTLPTSINPDSYIIFSVTFLAPVASGTHTSTISIGSNDTTASPYTFNVSAEVFNYNIPGPGGITADFRLWLKATRGVKTTATKVYEWDDLGTNPKNATQAIAINQPTYLDDSTNNINFNPVIKFENDGATLDQYLYNIDNGFYSQDIFIVMIPDNTISNASTGSTIFGGISSETVGDITGVGFGNYTTRFTNEILTYAQNTEASFNGIAEISTTKTYSNAGIINVRNDSDPATAEELLYNSKLITTSAVNDIPFANVGSISGSTVFGTKYWIGKNYSETKGSLNGRVAEILTFAQRVPDVDRPKIESYLAIKYGITLGSSNFSERDYVNSAGVKIWDLTANSGFKYDVAGIGRDSISDLNQKQSKSINQVNEVTIGLGAILATNNVNINEFVKNKDFLVWGNNNGPYTGASTNTVTIASGITTTLTRIDRKWKIIETKEHVSGDVGNVYVSIPSSAFSGFTKLSTEEYVLIVSDAETFNDADIIDVIPLKSDGLGGLQTWYDFDGTKFFTFGKAPQLTGNRLVSIASGDYLVGEYALNLNSNNFTISAWIKSTPIAAVRTIMAKGNKLQLRLNASNQVEVIVDNVTTPKYTSNMVISDSKWHQITFVYQSGAVILYIDGVLDKSVLGIEPPTPNYNHFSIGAVHENKNSVTNYFLGEIDEVYVWDQGLSEGQIRYLMNQEIEKVTGNFVNGKVIPQNITNNEVITIPWVNLRAYYDFNSFYGSTVEGLTNDRNFIRIKYLNKTKTIVNTQTAPLPYTTIRDGVWGDGSATTPWLYGDSVWNLPNSLGLDGATSVDWNIVETSHNISSGDRDISVLGLKNITGKITMANPNTTLDETNSGHGLHISHYLELDGVIDLVGESQLVQYEGSTLDDDSGGYLDRDQQGTANSYNYNYWSSSVGPITPSGASNRGTGIPSVIAPFTIGGVLMDGTTTATPGTINFMSSYTAADAGVSAPIKISTYWMYKFEGPENDYNSWVKISETTPLAAGEGYTMKGSSGNAAIATNQNYKFRGKPNNGTISIPILAGEDKLIGNPYPSAIDADEFIIDNIKDTINFNHGKNPINVFNGALYFWHHFGKSDSHFLSDYVGGYATYTLMGGTQAYATDPRINNATPLVGGGKVPERYIPVNQGFFVVAALDATLDSTTTSVQGGNIVFRNSQRVYEMERFTGTNSGSLFFKSSAKNNEVDPRKYDDKRPKIKLKFISPKGFYRQLLIGVDNNASSNFDIGYDAPIADLNLDDMYWYFNKGKFVIQAVNNFNKNQEFQLGLKMEVDGLATVKIDSLENMDANVELYIKDNVTGETYQINNKPFEVNLAAGEYLDRYSLTFQPRLKTLDEISLEEGILVYMDNTVSELKIKKTVDTEIKGIQVFNYLGQIVAEWTGKFSEREVALPIKKATGAYIVKLKTHDGNITKKIVIN